MKIYLVAGLLVLGAVAWAGNPIQGRLHMCRDGTYFDDVDKACVTADPLPLIDGIPQEELLGIARKHAAALQAIRGVTAVWIDRHGIRVEADADHDPIPDSMAGHPIHVMPSEFYIGASHTAPWAGTPIRQLIEGCPGGTYFDEVDKVCVQEGGVTHMHGHPFAEVMDTVDRRWPELYKIRGVARVGVDRHGIRVEVEPDHDPIPDEIEGHPIHIMPAHTGVPLLLGADLMPPR